MVCEKCNKENRSNAKFCMGCGNPLNSGATDALDALVGLDYVKKDIQNIIVTHRMAKQRSIRLNLNTLIIGNTGTGKTKLGEVFQEIFLSNGIITSPKLRMVDAVDFEEFTKDWDRNIKECKGGILFIDNAQKLLPGGYSDNINILDKLFNDMNKWGNDPIVILAGLPTGFEKFLSLNPNIKNRFMHHIYLKDYTAEELTTIAVKRLNSAFSLRLTEDSKQKLYQIFKYAVKHKDDSFGNAHLANNTAEQIFNLQLKRTKGEDNIVLPDDIQGELEIEKTVEEILAQLDEYVGISNVKDEIKSIISYIQVEKERNGGKIPSIDNHYIFTGNPGTGKTTIARVVAEIFRSLGVLPTGQLIEVDRSKLVSGFVGQSAPLTNKVIDSAIGGILFIDEAYTLIKSGNSNDFGTEAVEALLKRLEDDKGKFICIAAGYTKEMHDFIDANPGLKSRFNRVIEFQDYKPDELTAILFQKASQKGFAIAPDATDSVKHYFDNVYMRRDKNFGNAREVVSFLDKVIKRQGERIQKSIGTADYNPALINILTKDDIEGDEIKKAKPLDQVLGELDEFIGMDSIKSAVRDLAQQIAVNQMRLERGIGGASIPSVHIVLTGNPGTGKTTIARKLGEVFKSIKYLPTDTVIEVDRSQMVSQYVNSTPQAVNKLVDRALGGILFIDEAYTLAPQSSSGEKDKGGLEAIETLMKRMEDDKGKFVVIAAGYQMEMENFIRSNAGLERRFTFKLHIDDYTADQLLQILTQVITKNSYTLSPNSEAVLSKLVTQMVDNKGKNFGNAGEMMKLFDSITRNLSKRVSALSVGEQTDEALTCIEPQDIPLSESKEVTIEESLGALNNLTGLESVKAEVSTLANFLNVERQKAMALGKKPSPIEDHFVFTGNPGTGKTTVARIMAEVFHSLGIISKPLLVEADREKMVSGFVGQSAIKTTQLIDNAMGGVLFIDEAYTLAQGGPNDFGIESINTLLKRLEDDRGKFICIVAGYTKEMEQFINSNPGLKSRFNRTIHFPDYQGNELTDIFRRMLSKDRMSLTPDADTIIDDLFDNIYKNRDKNFGNAREVRAIYQNAIRKQSIRLASKMSQTDFNPDELAVLSKEDII